MHRRDIRFAAPKAPRHQLVLYPQYLDELLPPDAPVRALVALLDEVDWTPWEDAYAGCGQPPIHPRYLAGAILWGLLNRVRSSRDLERAGFKHLDFLWLLEGFTPDHSTYAAFRIRHAQPIKDLQRFLAETLVRTRPKPLLELILDGTRLRADSDRHGARTAQTLEAVLAELERRYAELVRTDETPAPRTAPLEGLDAPVDFPDGPVPTSVAALERQIETYRKALETARERDRRAREVQGQAARPVRVPVTDSQAQITPNKDGGFAPNYTPMVALEPETGAVVYDDVLEGSDEAGAVAPAVEAARAVTGQTPAAVLADGAFATGEVLGYLDGEDIDAYMPIRSASPDDNPAVREDPTQPVPEEAKARLPRHGAHFARSAFVYDPPADEYRCPAGHPMKPHKQGRTRTGAPQTTYRCEACPGCPWAKDCIKGKAPHRTVMRDAHEPLREEATARLKSEAGQAVYKKRAPGVEGVFACIKAVLGIRRFARRGLAKVRCDWTWICAGYNLKKLLARRAGGAGQAPAEGPSGGVNGARRGHFRLEPSANRPRRPRVAAVPTWTSAIYHHTSSRATAPQLA